MFVEDFILAREGVFGYANNVDVITVSYTEILFEVSNRQINALFFTDSGFRSSFGMSKI